MGDNWPSFPSFGLDGKPSSGISFTKGELTSAGQKLGDHVTYLQELEKRAGNLSVSFPHFGVLGMGVHSAHESAIESQREVLKRAKAALESWKPALEAADANYREADDNSGPGDLGGLPLGPGDMPSLGPMPSTDIPGAGLPGTDLPDLPEQGVDVAPTDMPNVKPPGVEVPDVKPPGTDVPGVNPPGVEVPGADLPGNEMPGAEMPHPNMPGTDPADRRVPDIDSARNPNRTDLAAHQPTPPNVPVLDPAATGVGTRTGTPIGNAVTGGPGS